MHTKDTDGPGCPLRLASNSFTEGFVSPLLSSPAALRHRPAAVTCHRPEGANLTTNATPKLTTEAELHPPRPLPAAPAERQNKEGKRKKISLKSCFHFPQRSAAGTKLGWFPRTLAQPKTRHIILYRNWMCLQSPTAWRCPQRGKSGRVFFLNFLKFAFEPRCLTTAAGGGPQRRAAGPAAAEPGGRGVSGRVCGHGLI